MQRHLHYKSLDEFRSLLYYATSEENFEERWTAFVNKWKTDKTEEWLRRMYRKRRLWAASYLSNGFFLGMRSNQRSESLNSSLHLHLDYGMTIVDLVVHYENCIVRLRENEANDDCEANQKVPPAVTEYKDIEEHAAKVFTPANFYILQNDLKKMGELEILRRWWELSARPSSSHGRITTSSGIMLCMNQVTLKKPYHARVAGWFRNGCLANIFSLFCIILNCLKYQSVVSSIDC